MPMRSTARPTTASACSTTRCLAGRSASATRRRPTRCSARRLQSTLPGSIRTTSMATSCWPPGGLRRHCRYLQRALSAPSRPGREIADRGRRAEASGAAGEGSLTAVGSRHGAALRRSRRRRGWRAAGETVQARDAGGDRQPEAAADGLLAAGPKEAVAQPGQQFRRHARAFVDDADGIGLAEDRDPGTGGSIANRVVQEVADRGGDKFRIADQRKHGGGFGLPLHVDVHRTLVRQAPARPASPGR